MKFAKLSPAISMIFLEKRSAMKRDPGGPKTNHEKKPDKKSTTTAINIFDFLWSSESLFLINFYNF